MSSVPSCRSVRCHCTSPHNTCNATYPRQSHWCDFHDSCRGIIAKTSIVSVLAIGLIDSWDSGIDTAHHYDTLLFQPALQGCQLISLPSLASENGLIAVGTVKDRSMMTAPSNVTIPLCRPRFSLCTHGLSTRWTLVPRWIHTLTHCRFPLYLSRWTLQ